MSRVRTGLIASLVLLAACGGPPPKSSQESGGVPANSVSENRLKDGDKKPDEGAPNASQPQRDPTQPYTTRVGDAPPPESAPAGKSGGKGRGASGASSASNAPEEGGGSGGGAGGGGPGRVSQAECQQMFDRLLDLEMASNPQLKGMPPEVIEQAKEMARQKGGAPPCTATRKEYSCAMAASSTAAWKRCVK